MLRTILVVVQDDLGCATVKKVLVCVWFCSKITPEASPVRVLAEFSQSRAQAVAELTILLGPERTALISGMPVECLNSKSPLVVISPPASTGLLPPKTIVFRYAPPWKLDVPPVAV